MGVHGKPGASLRVWRDYFPKAEIVGFDIDENILFQEDRIRTFACDQASPDSVEKLLIAAALRDGSVDVIIRSEEHTSEIQSLMRISYAVFCLKKKTILSTHTNSKNTN